MCIQQKREGSEQFFSSTPNYGFNSHFVNIVIIERAGLGLGQWVRRVVARVKAMV